ncbi:hypothetical protein GDO86_013490 [Hymenochirus boettgeri]|uniref:Uncharacterized protein n=1 Tax=Hymenochirus boettgeri TaxID=247094 RepID=A0A8T2IWZ3_9PIPI|nr:hypothetical protein GDO86_013490 [Hymenochirus boettgeri]
MIKNLVSSGEPSLPTPQLCTIGPRMANHRDQLCDCFCILKYFAKKKKTISVRLKMKYKTCSFLKDFFNLDQTSDILDIVWFTQFAFNTH